MIRVSLRPEPASFDADVRKRGRRAIDDEKNPLPPYWRRCLPDLWREYGGVCAYSCFHIPLVVGGKSVEHFSPKSDDPELAYEWSNYRLVCALMNSRKREFKDVLDPFEIEDGWFELEFLFMQVRPAPRLTDDVTRDVAATIDRLKLNAEECCAARGQWYDDWRAGEISDKLVERRAPFIHREAVRQGLLRPHHRPATDQSESSLRSMRTTRINSRPSDQSKSTTE